jgi:hypothetical protein
MILILSNPRDIHAKHVARKLHQRGRDVVCLSKADFGNGGLVTLSPNAHRGVLTLPDGTRIPSEAVSAVWHRRPGAVRANRVITDEPDRSFADNEWTQALDGFFSVASKRNVSPPGKQRTAIKPLQLSLASQAGLCVPATLITSDPEEALTFVARHRGRLCTKL